MKVSLNIIKKYIDIALPPVDELVARINEQLGAVEEVIDLADKYKDALIVRVVECGKHPDADRLNITKIDDGGVCQNVARDEEGLVRVVCGAPNVHKGMWAVWLPPESVVPSTYGDSEPFMLGARKLRGVMSQGMLAAGDELAINADHDGIVEITQVDLPSGTELKVGTSFAELFGLDDTIIDIENKMFTHRPDLFGQLGVAREVSAILRGMPDESVSIDGTRFVNPDWYWVHPQFEVVNDLELGVFNSIPDAVPRVMFVAMNGVDVMPSPLWLQCALVAMGSRPINNIVDATNYVMLMTAQPTHAYDYDKLRGATVGARMAKAGEKLTLLNGKIYELTSDDIVIADSDGPVALGGIMGGQDSEVSEGTKSIVLEVATFDMYSVRKSSMRHGLFTDALSRFNKGQSPLQNDRVMRFLMSTIHEVSSAKQASSVHDVSTQSWGTVPSLHQEIPVPVEVINGRLGVSFTPRQIGSMLRQVNIASYVSERDDQVLLVTPPFWRTDITIPEDVAEEVGRLYGFDKLPRELPLRSVRPVEVSAQLMVKRHIRDALAAMGANEVLTYSFVHKKTIERAGQDTTKAYQLSNALSPDLQYYRLSVLPSLLDKIHMNVKAGHDEFMLYEIGKAHCQNELDEDGLPHEFMRVAGVYTAKKPSHGASYFAMRQYIIELTAGFHFEAAVRFTPLGEFDSKDHAMLQQMAAPFDVERSAMVYVGQKFGGIVGELRSDVSAAFKLPEHTAAFELFLSFFESNQRNGSYMPLSRFPVISQDISLRGSADTPYQSIYDVALRAAESLVTESMSVKVLPLSRYQSQEDISQVTTTFRIQVVDHKRTLRDSDIKPIIDYIAASELAEHSLALV